MMTFRFRMLSDENDRFIREYEIPYDMTLLEFHRFICRDLRYDPENMASFFTSNAEWEKLREFTLFDFGGGEESEDEMPVPMDQVHVGQIVHKNRERLIYQFDMLNDRALYLELVEAKKNDKQPFEPSVLLSEYDAPDQFEPGAGEQESSIFEDAMGEFSDFEGDDSYDDEY